MMSEHLYSSLPSRWPSLNETTLATNAPQTNTPQTAEPVASTDHQDLQNQYLDFYNLRFENLGQDITHHCTVLDSQGFNVAVQIWRPIESKGTLFIVHGYWDHTGLYHHLIRHCLQLGFTVVVYDEPGHGLSSGERVVIDSFTQYTRVFEDLISICCDKLPGPYYAIGQSTGGAVLFDYLFTHPSNPFSNTLLLAPLIRIKNWHLASNAHKLVYPWLKYFPRDMRHLGSHDDNFCDFLRADPLQFNKASMKWLYALRQWVKRFSTFQSIDCPLAYIQGDKDETVDWHYNLPTAETRMPNLQKHIIAGARHNLVNESDHYRQQVMTIISNELGAA
jgi:lysophospholipase